MCGLKYLEFTHPTLNFIVTPFAGVWIEMPTTPPTRGTSTVTPFAGVWIEILFHLQLFSHSLVTPFAGVWIEIFVMVTLTFPLACYTLRGFVD